MENFALDSDIIMQIRHLSKCLKQDFDNKLANHGLTGTQGRVLFCINRCYEANKEIHQSDIEECFHLSKSSVSELVGRMMSNGLIDKVPVKPYYSLIPTEKGRSIVNEIHNSKKEVIQKLLEGFSEEEIERITINIQRMTKNIEKEDMLCGKK